MECALVSCVTRKEPSCSPCLPQCHFSAVLSMDSLPAGALGAAATALEAAGRGGKDGGPTEPEACCCPSLGLRFWRAQDRADGEIWLRSGDSGTSQDPRLQAATPNTTGGCRWDRAEVMVKTPALWKCKALCCFGIHAFYWRGLHF